MKTIEEATDDYMRNFDKKGQLFIEDIADAFRKGAEFAQQWIPVEDELPKEGETVLVKFKSTDFNDRIIDVVFEWKAGFEEDFGVEYWRPIEVK